MQPMRYARALESAASCAGVMVDSWVVVNARICVAFSASNSKLFSVSESITDCDHAAMLVVVIPLIWVAVIIASCVAVIALICFTILGHNLKHTKVTGKEQNDG